MAKVKVSEVYEYNVGLPDNFLLKHEKPYDKSICLCVKKYRFQSKHVFLMHDGTLQLLQQSYVREL